MKAKAQPGAKRRLPRPNVVRYAGRKNAPFNFGTRASLRINKLDTRTKIGKTAQLLYDCLWDFVGEANAPAMLLIDTIVFKKMKLILCESTQLEKPTEQLPTIYLTIANSLRQDLVTLAQFAQQPALPDLDSYLKDAHGN
jgi:hypothetical protein